MKNRWSETAKLQGIDLLVYRSRLIGEEPNLVLWGGGNTSMKLTETDHLGRQVRVLRVKGSGSDLKFSQAKDFAPLRLEELLAVEQREVMSDEEMVDYLNACLLNPKNPRPSIETLMHAFIPYDHVDHSHADAILALTNTKNNQKIFFQVFAQDMVWVPYIKPGFPLAKAVAQAVRKNSQARGAILEKHGIFTWGKTARESYETMIEMVTRAEQFVAATNSKPFGKTHPTASECCQQNYLKIAPTLRGLVSPQKRLILTLSDTPPILEFANSELGPEISRRGPVTPDHLLRTKCNALFVQNDLTQDLQNYQNHYTAYFNKHAGPETKLQDAFPRVVLIPEVGLISMGKNLKAAKIVRDIYQHTISVYRDAMMIDDYASLTEAEIFEMEYWPLELFKLTLAPPDPEMAGRIALITGAGSGIGRASAFRLVQEGAHLVIGDVDEASIIQVGQEIQQKFGPDVCVAIRMDVTCPDSVRKAFEQAVLHFGGLDLLISNAGIAISHPVDQIPLEEWEQSFAVNTRGHFLCAKEALAIFKQQGIGGNIVFVATKNVMAPGKDFAAYSASKAAEAQLAKVLAIENGPLGIRVNIVNPDAVFGDSKLWSETVRRERAQAHGIPPEQLEDFYRKRNLLHAQVTPMDVAETILFLASDRSAKTTGCTITVDGGVKEAFPR